MTLETSGERTTANVLNSFSSFVESHGQPLLDLSLYVSSENYNSVTRPAYSRILPWPKPWLVTPQRRTLAKARTAHLNLSSLDIDNASNEERNGIAVKPGSDLIPPSLRSTRQTVTSLARQPQHASCFRLDALSEAFFEPLQHLLGQKRFLLSDENPSSLDCLAFAYLALALLPEVPQPWLAESLKAKYPDLCHYVRDLIQEFFGGPIKVEDVLPASYSGESDSLPWRAPDESGTPLIGFSLVEAAFESVPIVGQLYKSNLLLESSNTRSAVESDRESVQAVVARPLNPILPAILAIGTVISGVAGYSVYSGLLNLRGGETQPSENRRLSDMGEAGAMLGMVDFSGNGSRLEAGDVRAGRIPVGLEIDVAVDQKGAL